MMENNEVSNPIPTSLTNEQLLQLKVKELEERLLVLEKRDKRRRIMAIISLVLKLIVLILVIVFVFYYIRKMTSVYTGILDSLGTSDSGILNGELDLSGLDGILDYFK